MGLVSTWPAAMNEMPCPAGIPETARRGEYQCSRVIARGATTVPNMTRTRRPVPTATLRGADPSPALSASAWALVASGLFTGLGGAALAVQAMWWAGPYFFNDGLDPRDPTYHLSFPTGSLLLLALGAALVVAGAVLAYAGWAGRHAATVGPGVWLWVLAVVAPIVVLVVDGFLLLLAVLGGL